MKTPVPGCEMLRLTRAHAAVPTARAHTRARTTLALFLLLLLTACPKAVTRVDDQLLGRVCFEVEPGWEITRNYRWMGSHHIQLSPTPPWSVLTVDLMRIGQGGEQLPLDLVAEGVVGELGRKVGMRTVATHQHEIVVDGRRTIALTGTRHHGPQEVEFTAWVTRTPGHLLIVMLQTPVGQLQHHSRLLQRLLESLELPQEPPPPEAIYGG
jgi:hypothetical protein